MPGIEYSAAYIEGLFLLSSKTFVDDRGKFKKLLSKDDFDALSLESNFAELYYSVSRKGVIRGMHFQLPPMEHIKMVYAISGKILDVCLDLRDSSKTFGEYFSCVLSGDDDKYLYIPKGVAHGFAALEDNSIVHYAQTSCYSKSHDFGVRYDSFGFNWNIENPIVSDRDKSFPQLADFSTVF